MRPQRDNSVLSAALDPGVYLDAAGHEEDLKGPLFRPVKNNRTKTLTKPLHPTSVYQAFAKNRRNLLRQAVCPLMMSACEGNQKTWVR